MNARIMIAALSIVVAGHSVASGQAVAMFDRNIQQELRSGEYQSRAQSVDKVVMTVRKGTAAAAIEDAEFQKTWLALLRQENGVHIRRFQDPEFAAHLDERWNDYYAAILEVSVEIVKKTQEATRRREWLNELLRGSYNPDSMFAAWLASYGQPVAEESLKLIEMPSVQTQRQNGYVILSQIVAASAFQPAVPNPNPANLSFSTRQVALRAVSSGLLGDDEVVAREIVGALARNPSTESVGILRNALSAGRGKPEFTTRNGFARSLQDELAFMIADGEKKTSPTR